MPCLSPYPALESEVCSHCSPITPFKMKGALLRRELQRHLCEVSRVLFYFFFCVDLEEIFHRDAQMQRRKEAFASGMWWGALGASCETFGVFLQLRRKEKKNTLNSSYPNDMFRASPIGPSLSGLIICTQIGDALLLMILTPFASWTINEEPQVPFLVPRLTWRPVILLHHTDLYIF